MSISHAQISAEIGSSPNPVGSGARAMGQGNAFIAVADDATAASWNPARLLQLELPEFSFAVEGIYRNERLNEGDGQITDNSDTLGAADFNYISFVYPFNFLTNMVFSVNYLKLFSFYKEIDFNLNTVTNEFSRVIDFDFDQDGELSVVAPAFGIDVTDRLSLGVTVNLWHHALTQSSAYGKTEDSVVQLTIDEDTSRTYRIVKNRFEVTEGYSFVIGTLYRLSGAWNLAAVVKPEYDLNLNHDHSIDFHQEFGDTVSDSFQQSSDDAELRFPWIIGVGAAWRPHDPFTVSMDVSWTQWSRHTFMENERTTNPLTGDDTKMGALDDTITVRFGTEYLVVREDYIIPFRLGLGYDPGPNVGEVDDFYTVNIGAGAQISNRINIDIAYEFRWGDDVHGAVLDDISATQDIRRHRFLGSMIYYF